MLEIPLSGIKRIEEIAKSSNEYISLSQGAIRVGGIPQQIKDYVQGLLTTDKTDYYESCWGIKPLREKLVEVLNQQFNANITINNVLPTHGCIGGLSLLYLSILEPGDEVIIPEPAYPAYGLLAQAARSKPVYVSAFKPHADGTYSWQLDIEKIKLAVTEKTKIIVFSNPWNPLGIIIPKKAIQELLTWCENKGIFLIIDEAYRDYAFTPDYQSTIHMVTQSEWLISAHTFSKNMAMSGWRIGYLIIPERINKVLAGMQDALLNCLNNPAQFAATYALNHPEFTQAFHQLIKQNRDMTVSMLQPLIEKNIISMIKPDGGFFAFFRTEHSDATDLGMSILYQAKVSLVPGGSFGPSGKPFLRLCFARDPDVLHEGITRLVNFLG